MRLYFATIKSTRLLFHKFTVNILIMFLRVVCGDIFVTVPENLTSFVTGGLLCLCFTPKIVRIDYFFKKKNKKKGKVKIERAII